MNICWLNPSDAPMHTGVIKQLPICCGVYCIKFKSDFLYIGYSRNLRNRLREHIYHWNENIINIGFIKTFSIQEARTLEKLKIKKYNPQMNVTKFRLQKELQRLRVIKDH